MSEFSFTPDVMLEHAESIASTAFARFNHAISNHGIETLYCFVEGHDLPYYHIRINTISGKTCKLINSKGKKGVLAIYNMLKNKPEYNRYKKLFFVDKDYDDNDSLEGNIYVTPGYSVENFYGSIDCFKNIIEGTYHIYEDNPKFTLCIELYSRLKDDFINATSCFCAWYRCTKCKVNHKVELSESFPDCYATFQSDSIVKSDYDLVSLNRDYPDVDDVTNDEFEESVAYIDNNIFNIRGKYVMQFIEYIIKLLNKDSKTCKRYTDSKVEFEPNRKTLIARLSGYADTPNCLRDYILHHS